MKLLDELLRESIGPLLKANGFKKTAGLAFERDGTDVIVVIAFQRSRQGGDCDKFTANLGIGSKRIFAFEDKRTNRRTPVDLCHWRMRLGRTLEDSADMWWELCGPADLPAVGDELREILTTKALPLLSRMSSDEALRAEWRAGRAPGLTELQRLLNLSVLLNDTEHLSEMPAVVGQLKDLAHGKGFGGRVAVHLEELGVE